MRTFLYIGIGAALLALAMFLSGPTIKASGTAYRATHRMISGPLARAADWSARI